MHLKAPVGVPWNGIAGLALGTVLALGGASTAHAQMAEACSSVTTSFPTVAPTDLLTGTPVTIDVRFQNATRTQPSMTFVPGQVGGDTCVANTSCNISGKACTTDADCTVQFALFLACTTSTCAIQLPGTLNFVPQGGNGCLTSMAGVLGCAIDAGNPNRVLVTLAGGAANAIPIGANAEILIAQVRATAGIPIPMVIDPNGGFEVRVVSLTDVFFTDSPLCLAPVTGAGDDSTSARFPVPPTPPVPAVGPLGLALTAAALLAGLAWRSRRRPDRAGI